MAETTYDRPKPLITISADWLVLLCHATLVERVVLRRCAQHGHRSSVGASAAISSRRRVAMESGTWRSVRTGSASRSVILGKRRDFEEPAASRL